jgi:hypothetical protein
MYFERTALNSFAEPVSSNDLQVDSIYFTVQYADPKMLNPIIETLVYIGTDLNNEGEGRVYFQTLESYQTGVRLTSARAIDGIAFRCQAQDQLNHIFEFGNMLKELMKCSLRRDSKAPNDCS